MGIFDDIGLRNMTDNFMGTGGYGGNFNGGQNPYLQGPGMMGAPMGVQNITNQFDQQYLAQLQAFQNQTIMQEWQQQAFQGQNPYAQQYEELFRDNSVKQPTQKPKPVKAVKPKDTVRRLDLDGGSEVATPAVVARQIDF